MAKRRIGLIVGSLRKGAYTRIIADYLLEQKVDNLELEIVEIGHLPLYNQDYDNADIEGYSEFKEKIAALDGYIFITPEHNRSFPAALKNAIDIASRPLAENRWGDKPGAIISSSISALGGFGSNHHLRQVMVILGVYMMERPECYVGSIQNSVEDGKITNKQTQKYLSDFLKAYSQWVERVKM